MLDIALLPEEYAVCQLPVGTPAAEQLLTTATGRPVTTGPGLVSVTWTMNHVSVICRIDRLPDPATTETRWRCLHVLGPVNQAMTGVLAVLVRPLTEARVNLVAFSAYDTDYLLVPAVRLAEALAALTRDGHRIVG